MAIVAVPYSSRPDLWERIAGLSAEVWPEYNRHGDVLNAYWDRLYDEFPDFQFVLYDEDADEVLAEGQTIPVCWDGDVDRLGPGIDATIVAGFDRGGAANALSALAAEIPPRNRRRDLSAVILREMARLAADRGWRHLVAPVRPSVKEHYPLVPIERYVRWHDDRGEPFDPWLRVHARMGATIATPLPRSLHITGTVAEWESWTGLRFPDDGVYVFPNGLAPVTIDRAADLGDYWEPNVWVIHDVGGRVR